MNPNLPPVPKSIYLGGCAFGLSLYVGMYRAMTEMWGRKFCEDVIVCGDSAGSILAVSMALGNSPEYCEHHVLSFATLAHNYGTMNQLNVFIELKLREMICDPLAYKQIEGRCYIGCTSFFSKHTWRCEWTDNDDLIQWILYSCRIPFYFRRYRVLQEPFLDGALSIRGSDLPCGDDTLTIILNDSRADIVQSLPFQTTYFPMIDEAYSRSIQQGYDSMLAWDGVLKSKQDVLYPSYLTLLLVWLLFALESLRSFLIDLCCSCLYLQRAYTAMIELFGWRVTGPLPDVVDKPIVKDRTYLHHLDSFFQLSSGHATTHDDEESIDTKDDLEHGIVIDSSMLSFDDSFDFITAAYCTYTTGGGDDHSVEKNNLLDETMSLSQQDSEESRV